MHRMKCPAKDCTCKKISLVAKITNLCSACHQIFCDNHVTVEAHACSAIALKREQEHSTLREKLPYIVSKKIEPI